MQPQLDGLLQAVTQDVPGAEVVRPRVKGRVRLDEKLRMRPPETIEDYLAARVIVDRMDDADQVVDVLRQQGRIIRDSDFFHQPTRAGYRARHVQVELPNGMTAEVQIMPPEMHEAQMAAHPLYEGARTSGADLQMVAQANAEMRRLYRDGYRRYQARLRREGGLPEPPPSGGSPATPRGGGGGVSPAAPTPAEERVMGTVPDIGEDSLRVASCSLRHASVRRMPSA